MCRRIWCMESDCDCQWENSLSRKTSRRNRIEAILKNHQRLHPDDENSIKMPAEDNVQHQQILLGQSTTKEVKTDEWSNPLNDYSDNEDEEIFWVSLLLSLIHI